MRKTIDGSLVAKNTGTPPDCPEGYLRSQTDPYRFIPIRVSCDLRSQELVKRNCCGGGTTKTYCEIIGRILITICDRCKGDKEWATQYQKKYG